MKNHPATLRTLLNAAVRRVQLFVLLTMCLGILLAYLVGMYVTGPFHAASRWMGAMLACTSVVVVLQKAGDYKSSLQLGGMRVLGTFMGALIAYVYLILFSFSVAGMLCSVFLLEMLFMLLNIYNNGHIATITLVIIMLISQRTPDVNPAVNCLLRFFESAVGVGIGIGLLLLTEAWSRWRRRLPDRGAGRVTAPASADGGASSNGRGAASHRNG